MEDLIYKISNFITFSSSENIYYSRFLINLIVCSFFGIVITVVHSKFSFTWMRSKNFIYIAAVLPPIGLTITTVISSNIALSLGMIGALSIVRFRTPIRSSYELIYYFALLTIGISINVSFPVTLTLFILIIVLPIFINFLFQNLDYFSAEENKAESIFEMNISHEQLKKIIDEKSTTSLHSVNKDNGIIEVRVVKAFKNRDEEILFYEKWKDKISGYEIIKN